MDMENKDSSKLLAENVRRLLREHPVVKTQAKLAEKSGLGQSSISRVLREDTVATTDTIDSIAKAFGVLPANLLQKELGKSNVIPAPVGARKIPLISYVQAGMWTDIVDSYALGDGSETLLTDLDLGKGAFGLEIDGDSMLPEFSPGDRVIIDPSVSPRPGDFVVAKNGSEEATFKKYRPRGIGQDGKMIIELVPLNDDFEKLRSDITPFVIIGTMVEHRKYRKGRR